MCREQGEGGWWWWRRRPGTRHACGGRARETREARKRGRRRRGVVRKARPPDPHRPHTRGEGARSRTQPSVHEGRSTPPAATPCRNEGRGGAGRGGAPPPPSAPHPPSRARPPRRPREPGRGPPDQANTGDGRRALRRPSVRPPQRGGGCRAARTRRPARGRQTGGDPTRARESASGAGGAAGGDRKSTRLNSSHRIASRMPSSA